VESGARLVYGSHVSRPSTLALLGLVAGCVPACRPAPVALASGARVFHAAGLQTTRLGLGVETREAVQGRPETPVSSHIVVRPRSVLQLAIGLKCPGKHHCPGSWRFSVEAGSGPMRRPLFESTLQGTASGAWQPVRIRLDPTLPLGATDVAFRVSAPEPGPAVPFWGEARLMVAPEATHQNVILISVDTLRADRLGCYGYPRPTSPRIDAFARQGVRFGQAISQAPWTTPSHTSLLTSRYPSSHHVNQSWSAFDRFLSEGRGYRVLAEEVTTLAEVLQERGYRTMALTGGATLRADVGFAQGFDVYREDSYGLLKTVRPMVAGWMTENREVPFFLFLHTFEVHAPYRHPEMAQDILTGAEQEAIHEYARRPESGDVDGFARHLRSLGLFRREVTSALYDGGIHFTDAFLGLVLEDLHAIGLEGSTLVVVTSDHGEEFGDHEPARFYDAHCQTVFDEMLRVPLILRMPGKLPAGRVVDVPVELVDVAPTILEILGIQAPPAMEGKSFGALAQGLTGTHKEWTLSESTCNETETKALRSPTRKYIAAYETRDHEHSGVPGPLMTEWIFDLERDPGETRKLGGRRPLRTLRSILEERATDLERRGTKGSEAPVSADVLERLRGLGYVQ
jgi:arylsulfatase A-like enzyme